MCLTLDLFLFLVGKHGVRSKTSGQLPEKRVWPDVVSIYASLAALLSTRAQSVNYDQ